MEKNDAQISGFSVVKKASSLCKKCFSKKKSIQFICAGMIFKTVCGSFVEINRSRDIYFLAILRFRKIVLLTKLLIKFDWQKYKWDVIISSSLRLLLKMWIWYGGQNRIENYYHHDEKELSFYKKVHIKTQNWMFWSPL